jgi:demethylmenaquinone methyltransferase/2-methoxy-6-polyprenyl-1,4-benzoquinol methylase
MDDDNGILAEQRAYYRLRAPFYDDWWRRQGRYAKGPDDVAEWEAEVAHVEAALDEVEPLGRVLELAGGTGWWTQRLARSAASLTVVDASPETLALNRERVGRDDVDYVIADLFEWQPDPLGRFDLVFFSFWLSHVPRPRLAAFWETVGRALAPGGRAFFIDNIRGPRPGLTDPYITSETEDVQVRHLGYDDSAYRVVKVYYEPDELAAQLGALGWDATIATTPVRFIYGTAKRMS